MVFLPHKNIVTVWALMVLLFWGSWNNIYGQQIRVVAEPDTIRIGEQTQLRIEVSATSDKYIFFPVIAQELLPGTEILRFGRIDTLVKHQEFYTLGQQLTLTSWEEGYHPIPAFVFKAVHQSDTLLWQSEAFLLTVKGVALAEDAQLKDIKTIWRVPLSFAEIWPWGLGFLLLILLVWAAIYYWKKYKNQPKKLSIWEKPEVPAHVAALNSLEKLKSQKLWQQGKVKLYYSELTDILRHYLEKRFGLMAMEMTSEDILSQLQGFMGDRQRVAELKSILEVADLVKFARFQPEERTHEHVLATAIDWVRHTIEQQAETSNKASERKV